MPNARERQRPQMITRRDDFQRRGSEAVETPDAPAVGDRRKRSRKDVQKFLEQARTRFKQGQDATRKQIQRELSDLKFYNGEQWPEDVRTARAGQNASGGLPPVPARPCITVNKTREPVRQVLNQERQSDIGIEVVPADDFAESGAQIDDSEIRLREGLVRRIQRESEAHDARTWAFSRAVVAGRGFYRVMTRYLPGKTRDQEIRVERIFNQASVTIDPSHEQPDGSDMEWGFIGSYLPKDQYEAEFPTAADNKPNRIIGSSDEEFQGLGEAYPEWFKQDGTERLYRVVEYFYTERTTRTLAMLSSGEDVWEDDLTVAEKKQDYDTREVTQKIVRWAKIDATQILDETDWAGQYIPIIKVLGEELHPHDSERRAEGMVRPMKESNRGFNYMVSKWVETIALSPIPPLLVAEGQVEGYEQWYNAANTRTLPYLPYKTRDLVGNQVGPPTAPDRNLGAVIGPLSLSVQMFAEAIQSTSATHDPSLGKDAPNAKSGRAIKALQDQSTLATSNYQDNLTRSMRYEARIINDLLYAIYGRPGRIARILNPQGEAESVMLHQPFTRAANGRPQPAQQGDQQAQHLTLTDGAHFDIAVKVTRAYDTRRQEEAAMVGDLISAQPELMTWFGDLYFKNLDGPGHAEMADRAKAMLAAPVQALLKQQSQGQPDPRAMQQLQSENEQLKQQLQQAAQQIQQDTAKYQAQGQIEQMKLQGNAALQIRLKEMDNAAKIEVARITAAKELSSQQIEAQEERLSTGLQLQADAQAAALDRAHDVGMAAMEAQHAQQAQTSDQQAAMAQQQQAQAAQPPPQSSQGAPA